MKSKKTCEHDWREVCWTGKSIMSICIECRSLKLELRTKRHENRIRNLELNPPDPIMIFPFYDRESRILIKLKEKGKDLFEV